MIFNLRRQKKSETSVNSEHIQGFMRPGLSLATQHSAQVPAGLVRRRTVVDCEEELGEETVKNLTKSKDFVRMMSARYPDKS